MLSCRGTGVRPGAVAVQCRVFLPPRSRHRPPVPPPPARRLVPRSRVRPRGTVRDEPSLWQKLPRAPGSSDGRCRSELLPLEPRTERCGPDLTRVLTTGTAGSADVAFR
ncbi:unnamed protein product [Coccothraustes coccothraustes]